MPPKRKRTAKERSSAAKAVYKRARVDNFSRLNALRSFNSPIASQLRTRVKYHTNTTIGPGLPVSDYQWRLNSLFDPDVIVAGHQPLGTDQLKTLYARYRVLKCSYKIRVTSSINSGLIGVWACAVPTNSNGSITNGSDAQEMRGAKWDVTGAQLGDGIRLYGMVDLPTLNGKTLAEYRGDDNCAALFTADPTEILNLHLVVGSTDLSTNVTCNMQCTLTYYVELYDPTQLAQS